MDQNDFTTNDIIDNIKVGDNTVDIVGYVSKMADNFKVSAGRAKLFKIIINNGQGREVQVIAWNENTDLLKKATLMGKIVYVGSAKAAAIKDKKYNSGNVDFEFIMKENSSFEVFNSYNECSNVLVEEVSITEAYERINKRIKVEGIVKSEFRKYQNRDFEFFVGSITDCSYKLEVKFNVDNPNFNFKKGASVEIIGTMEQIGSGPPVLKVDNVDDVKLVERDRVPFFDVLEGFRNRQL